MKVGVIGGGYVGLVSASCFAKLGFNTMILENDKRKINKIQRAISPIYEDQLDSLLKLTIIQNGNLSITNDRDLFFKNSDIIFICLPTPSQSNGEIDLNYILKELMELGKLISKSNKFKFIIIKSSVVPGSTSGIIKSTLEVYSNKKVGFDFGLGVNPEFLMEGQAINNFFNPDRIVIGTLDQKTKTVLSKLYESFNCPKLFVTLDEAEMIKYVSNSFLATKISFINQIANLSENFNINMDNIVDGIGTDKRISKQFLRSGLGFGGSCFPKDVLALYNLSKQYDSTISILKKTLEINNYQPLRVVKLLKNQFDLKNKNISLLGLSFKPGTDDIREAPSLKIVKELIKYDCNISVYDPAHKNTKLPSHQYLHICESIEEVLNNSDAAILVTEWDEFKSLEPVNFSNMNNKLIIDGRRILDPNIYHNSNVKLITIGNSRINSS